MINEQALSLADKLGHDVHLYKDDDNKTIYECKICEFAMNIYTDYNNSLVKLIIYMKYNDSHSGLHKHLFGFYHDRISISYILDYKNYLCTKLKVLT